MTAGSLKIAIQKEFLDVFNASAINKTGKLIATEVEKLMWERTDAGYDTKGGQWRRHKAKNYDKVKRKYGKRANADWIDLTGDLRRGLKVKYKSHVITTKLVSMQFTYEVRSDQEKKLKGLLDTTGYDRYSKPYEKSAWSFLGLSEAGVWKSKEDRAIAAIIKQQIGTARSKFTKKQSITI